MPGFDGTGPKGLGPFTGRGMGYCVINLDSKNAIKNSEEKEVINMPGGDRTGPAGMGPMTGRTAGYCAGYPVPGYMNPVGGGMGLGWGRGFGRGRGRGRGLGRGFGFRGAGYPYAYADPAFYGGYSYAPELTPQQEADMLKDQAKGMQEEIKAINNRISELETAAKKSK